MDEALAQRLARARAELEATREALGRTERHLRQTSVTVTSPDRSVEVTVGPQGELTELRFLDGKYRSMGAAQLAAAVLDAARQGRARVAQQVMDAFGSLAARHPGDGERRGMDIDWQAVFGPLHSAAEQAAGTAGPGAAGGRAGRGTRLRDEIHEDGDDGER